MSVVLVTGAAGFIGTALISYFRDSGDTVYGWDICDRYISGMQISKVDLLDQTMLTKRLSSIKPDIVIHCAGAADVRMSVENPYGDYERNVTITHNLLFALHDCGLDHCRFIFLSSAGVYGSPTELPIKESAPVKPLSPYALHKVMCEEVCLYFADNYGMDVRIARIFSAYGAGLRKQIFWDMNQKLENTHRLDMFGTGMESRDYIHVEDLVYAVGLIAKAGETQRIINVANGEEKTIREVTELFAACNGLSEESISFNGVVREGDPLNWRADITSLKALGYEPRIDMKTGIGDYVSWVKHHADS